MKTSFLVLALMTCISVHVAVTAISSESLRLAYDLPGGIPPIKTNSVVVTPLFEPS